jgi:type I restriction enzyme R subunit
MYGFDWSAWTGGDPAARLGLLPAGQEHILEQEDGKSRFSKTVLDLSRAFALCAASDEAIAIRDDLSFFQAIRAALLKPSGSQPPREDLDYAIRQLVSKAITASDEVIDIFDASGIKKPDISILSEEFLAEVKNLPQKNVAIELLRKLLEDDIRVTKRKNVVQARQFSELLKKTLIAYQNRAIATQEVLEELLTLAKEMRDSHDRGDDLGLSDDEVAFYDALAMNESAVDLMGIDELKVIATELVTKIRRSVTIDWTIRESARARMRVMVRRILRDHGYPPDLQATATKTVLEQAEALCTEWAAI